MNDKLMPLFTVLEASPLIHEAVSLYSTLPLDEHANEPAPDGVLGDTLGSLGPLRNCEVVHLLYRALAKLIQCYIYLPSYPHFQINATIHHLYDSYTRRFRSGRTRRDAKLEALLARLLTPYGNTPLRFSRLSRAHWDNLIAAGARALRLTYPVPEHWQPLPIGALGMEGEAEWFEHIRLATEASLVLAASYAPAIHPEESWSARNPAAWPNDGPNPNN